MMQKRNSQLTPFSSIIVRLSWMQHLCQRVFTAKTPH